MNTEELVTISIRAVMSVTRETQKQVAVAAGIGMTAVNAKMNQRTRWTLTELDAIAEHWMMRTIDLMQGPAHAVNSLPTAPRQRGRASAA